MSVSPEFLSELIDRHWGPLIAWVGPHSTGAEDAVQQTFIKLAALKKTPDNVTGWLYKVSRNEARNQHLYSQRRRRRQRIVAKQEAVTESKWSSAEATELVGVLTELPDEMREIVVAKIWGELSFDEIAGLLGSSKATVWRRYDAAISILRKTYGVSCPTKT